MLSANVVAEAEAAGITGAVVTGKRGKDFSSTFAVAKAAELEFKIKSANIEMAFEKEQTAKKIISEMKNWR